MVALKNAVHKSPVNRAAVLGEKFRQLFLALLQRLAAFAGLDKRVKGELGDPLGVAFSEQGGFERAR